MSLSKEEVVQYQTAFTVQKHKTLTTGTFKYHVAMIKTWVTNLSI